MLFDNNFDICKLYINNFYFKVIFEKLLLEIIVIWFKVYLFVIRSKLLYEIIIIVFYYIGKEKWGKMSVCDYLFFLFLVVYF